MNSTPHDQLVALAGAFLVGLALGLLYDLIRPVRRRAPAWLEYLLDLFYCALFTITVFLCARLLSQGQLRFFLLFVNGLGAFCYFQVLSRPIRALFGLIERLLSILLYPFRLFFSTLAGQLSHFFQCLRKSLKKSFSFFTGWFRIETIRKKPSDQARQPSGTKEEEKHDQNQKGWSCD